MDLDFFISHFSYLGIFVLMVTNGATNFPSSQLLYVIAGYFVSTGALSFLPTLIAGACGNTLGNAITFLLVKKHGVSLARRLLMIDVTIFDKTISALHTTFKEHGMWYIFFGKLIPSVKAFIAVVAGLAHLRTLPTVIVFFFSSIIWAGGVLSLGYFFGKTLSLSYLPIVSLLIGGGVFLFIYKKFSNAYSR